MRIKNRDKIMANPRNSWKECKENDCNIRESKDMTIGKINKCVSGLGEA